MKNLINFKHVISFIMIVVGIALLQSCVPYNPYYSRQMVTVPDIIQMSKDGVPSIDIIRDIRKSHTVYGLKADQLAKLRDEGVQDSVINYMEKTHMDAVRENQQYADSYYWYPYNGYMYGGLGFGWPYWGSPFWGWGPTIVFSGRGRDFDYHGGFHGGGEFHGGGGGFHGGGGFRGGRR